MVNASDVAKAGFKYLGTPYSKLDCQAFVEQCLADNSVWRNLPGSNAWFREMTWTGTPDECKRTFGEIPVGAFLFILEKDGKEPEKYKADGIGNASHIGIYTGLTGKQMVELARKEGNVIAESFNKGDGAIHSSSSRNHVCTSTFKGKAVRGGWNMIGLWNTLNYGADINARLRSAMPAKQTPDPFAAPETPVATGTVFASNGTTVKLRQRPSTGCATYWNVPIGELVEIFAFGDWDRIRWNGRIGYMKNEFIKVGETMATIEPDPAEVPILATVWAENGNTVKMRYQPSTACAIYEKVPVGTQVAVNQKGDKWCKVSLGNRSGWYMMSKFLKLKEE